MVNEPIMRRNNRLAVEKLEARIQELEVALDGCHSLNKNKDIEIEALNVQIGSDIKYDRQTQKKIEELEQEIEWDKAKIKRMIEITPEEARYLSTIISFGRWLRSDDEKT